MLRRTFAAATVAVLATLPAAQTAQAEDYPVNRLTLVVPFNPGGSADRMARAVASFLPSELGDIPVTVVNRPGGSGTLGHTWFLQQPDDGSFALITPANPYLISNVLRSDGRLNWDDFHFINGQWQDYYVLFVNNEQPFQTADELMDFIVENPGEASAAVIAGDGGHLSTLILLEQLGLPSDAVNFITYDGGGPMRTAIAGNQVTFSITAALGTDVIADHVRPLAVFQDEPRPEWDAPLINDILAERGLEVPTIAADLRTLTVHRSFYENHPDRYEMLVEAYRRTLEREDFQRFIAASAIAGDWRGPEVTQSSLNESFEIFSRYIHVLED